jgi:ring-1,2-phenylacetyl-CoA epoxidase subunit PaaC
MPDHLLNYVLHLADNSLIMGHRLSEWTGHGPMLEQDIAISNIALDHIGQSRNLYQYAAQLKGNNTTEDSLAYLRQDREFKNLLLTELPNGDWATTTGKLFFFSSFQYLLYQELFNSMDKQLSAIAEKSLKEVTYHRRWSSEWIIRLGDGTDESHTRMQDAVNELCPFTGEMFTPDTFEIDLLKDSISVDVRSLKTGWEQNIKAILSQATVTLPAGGWMQDGGKRGIHTEHLGFILAEMQYLQKTYPGCEW